MLKSKSYLSKHNQVVIQPEHAFLLAVIDSVDSEGNYLNHGIQPIGLESPWR